MRSLFTFSLICCSASNSIITFHKSFVHILKVFSYSFIFFENISIVFVHFPIIHFDIVLFALYFVLAPLITFIMTFSNKKSIFIVFDLFVCINRFLLTAFIFFPDNSILIFKTVRFFIYRIKFHSIFLPISLEKLNIVLHLFRLFFYFLPNIIFLCPTIINSTYIVLQFVSDIDHSTTDTAQFISCTDQFELNIIGFVFSICLILFYFPKTSPNSPHTSHTSPTDVFPP